MTCVCRVLLVGEGYWSFASDNSKREPGAVLFGEFTGLLSKDESSRQPLGQEISSLARNRLLA